MAGSACSVGLHYLRISSLTIPRMLSQLTEAFGYKVCSLFAMSVYINIGSIINHFGHPYIGLGNYAPDFCHYSIPNFLKYCIIMLIIIPKIY